MEEFIILEQNWDSKKLNLSFSFITKDSVYDHDFSLNFILDIAGNQKTYPMDASISVSKAGTNYKVQCDIKDFKFAKELTLDDKSNFSAIQVKNTKIDLMFNVPVYCGLENGDNLVVEVFEP